MQIELTNEEYKGLIEALTISHWVKYAFDPEGPPDTAPDEQLAQKIFSYAAVFDAKELVEFYPDLGRSYVTQKFADEAPIHEQIGAYEDQLFWQQLVTRLAERDLMQHFGPDRLEQMSVEEEDEWMEKLESAYWDVFEKEGVAQIDVPGAQLPTTNP